MKLIVTQKFLIIVTKVINKTKKDKQLKIVVLCVINLEIKENKNPPIIYPKLLKVPINPVLTSSQYIEKSLTQLYSKCSDIV